MKFLTNILTLVSLIALTGCGSDTTSNVANDDTKAAQIEVAKIDSLTQELEQTSQEIKAKEASLDNALKDLDF